MNSSPEQIPRWTGALRMPAAPAVAASTAVPVGAARAYARPSARYFVLKRAIDVAVCGLGLLILSPLFLLITVAVLLDDGWPVFFGQKRSGEDGREFSCWKFRTMIRDAEAVREQLEAENEASGPVFKIKRDPRITGVGNFLRRTSLDELPQLWNILRGEMTLVGPRPPMPAEVAEYTSRQRGRLAARPGLTCLWQISGRSLIGFDRWVEMDLDYVERRSLGLDLWVLLRTVPAVLTGRGAY